MIDTYFDRADAATGYRPTPSAPIHEDPRYWAGRLYATVLDRHMAKAKHSLACQISSIHSRHSFEIRNGFKLGDFGSQFTKEGRRK
jgi:hypothetical protein